MLYDFVLHNRGPLCPWATLAIRSFGLGLDGSVPRLIDNTLVDYGLVTRITLRVRRPNWSMSVGALFELAGHLSRSTMTLVAHDMA